MSQWNISNIDEPSVQRRVVRDRSSCVKHRRPPPLTRDLFGMPVYLRAQRMNTGWTGIFASSRDKYLQLVDLAVRDPVARLTRIVTHGRGGSRTQSTLS